MTVLIEIFTEKKVLNESFFSAYSILGQRKVEDTLGSCRKTNQEPSGRGKFSLLQVKVKPVDTTTEGAV